MSFERPPAPDPDQRLDVPGRLSSQSMAAPPSASSRSRAPEGRSGVGARRSVAFAGRSGVLIDRSGVGRASVRAGTGGRSGNGGGDAGVDDVGGVARTDAGGVLGAASRTVAGGVGAGGSVVGGRRGPDG